MKGHDVNDKVLCVDIGGSSVKSGVFSPAQFKETRTLVDTSPIINIAGSSFADVRDAVVQAIEYVMRSTDANRLGISTTGTVRPDGIVLGAGHFDDYEMIDWSAILRTSFPSLLSVNVVNDGKASAWAEYSYYDGGKHSHVHFVVGTGVGSSVVVNGELLNGDSGEAGFLGHTVVTSEPTIICSCDRQGCLETIASGPGLVHEYNKVSSTKISDFAEFTETLRNADPAAVKVVDASAYHFGNIIGVLANGINPRTITFGGGVMLGLREAFSSSKTDGYFLERVKERIQQVAFRRSASTTNLEYARFDNNGGLIGAALLATDARD
jgi:glucokinase